MSLTSCSSVLCTCSSMRLAPDPCHSSDHAASRAANAPFSLLLMHAPGRQSLLLACSHPAQTSRSNSIGSRRHRRCPLPLHLHHRRRARHRRHRPHRPHRPRRRRHLLRHHQRHICASASGRGLPDGTRASSRFRWMRAAATVWWLLVSNRGAAPFLSSATHPTSFRASLSAVSPVGIDGSAPSTLIITHRRRTRCCNAV